MSFKVKWQSLSACSLVDAVVIEAVTSFKLEWRSFSACIPVDAVVVGHAKLLKMCGAVIWKLQEA